MRPTRHGPAAGPATGDGPDVLGTLLVLAVAPAALFLTLPFVTTVGQGLFLLTVCGLTYVLALAHEVRPMGTFDAGE